MRVFDDGVSNTADWSVSKYLLNAPFVTWQIPLIQAIDMGFHKQVLFDPYNTDYKHKKCPMKIIQYYMEHKLYIFIMKTVVLHIHQAPILFGLIIVKHKSH